MRLSSSGGYNSRHAFPALSSPATNAVCDYLARDQLGRMRPGYTNIAAYQHSGAPADALSVANAR